MISNEDLLENLGKFIQHEDIEDILSKDTKQELPLKIRNIIEAAEKNLQAKKNNRGKGVDPVFSVFNSSSSLPGLSFGIDGEEEKEQDEDPVSELLDDGDKEG